MNNHIPIFTICPRNGYFTEENIIFALDTLLLDHAQILIFIPDNIDSHNLMAYGYCEIEAREKTAKWGEAIRRTVDEICNKRNYTYEQVRIIGWQIDVEGNDLYQQSISAIEELYKTNEDFQTDCRATTRQSIESKMKNNSRLRKYIAKTGIEKAINIAVPYILSELAFLTIAPELFGRKLIKYIYHREWPIYQRYIAGGYDGALRPKLGFICITNPSFA